MLAVQDAERVDLAAMKHRRSGQVRRSRLATFGAAAAACTQTAAHAA
jgi:hypothetical protein